MMGSDSRVCGCCGRKRAPKGSDYVAARSRGLCCADTAVASTRGAARVLGCGGRCYGACSVRRYPEGTPDDQYREPLGPFSYGPPGIQGGSPDDELQDGPPDAFDVQRGNAVARATLLDHRDRMLGRGRR